MGDYLVIIKYSCGKSVEFPLYYEKYEKINYRFTADKFKKIINRQVETLVDKINENATIMINIKKIFNIDSLLYISNRGILSIDVEVLNKRVKKKVD